MSPFVWLMVLALYYLRNQRSSESFILRNRKRLKYKTESGISGALLISGLNIGLRKHMMTFWMLQITWHFGPVTLLQGATVCSAGCLQPHWSLPATCQLHPPFVTVKTASRHGQMSPGTKIDPVWEPPDLEVHHLPVLVKVTHLSLTEQKWKPAKDVNESKTIYQRNGYISLQPPKVGPDTFSHRTENFYLSDLPLKQKQIAKEKSPQIQEYQGWNHSWV